MALAGFQTLDIIEEITRLDGSKYKEIGNLLHNGQAEYAVEEGMISEVRILKLNIPHSNSVQQYEQFVNEHFDIPAEVAIDHYQEWTRPQEMDQLVIQILSENKVS